MGTGSKLTLFEKGQVTELAKANCSLREIARQIGRSHTAVWHYVRDPTGYNKKNSGGRPQKLSKRDKLRIKRALKKQPGITSPQLIRELDIKVSQETMQRHLKRSNFQYRRRKPAPLLTKKHKAARIEFAKNNMDLNWNRVIFSDEKTFNLDGPSGSQYHWQDASLPPEIFSTRKFKGGGVSAWAAISSKGGIAMILYEGKFTSKDYISWLQDSKVFENARNDVGPSFIFQQDNAAQHTAASTRSFFESRNVEVMDFPAHSPDLNPIENVWAIMVKQLYEKGTQYRTKEDLIGGIQQVWKGLSTEVFKNLYSSMKERIAKVLLNHGAYTGY